MVAVSSSAQSKFSLAKAKQKRETPPPKLVIYGEAGIGKTSFAAGPGKDVIFLPLESGIDGLGVDRLVEDDDGSPGLTIKTYDSFIEALSFLLHEEHDYKWLAIDTLDVLLRHLADKVTDELFGGARFTKSGKEGFDAFGKGDRAVADRFREVLHLLDRLRAKGMGIIILSHDGLHKQGNALGSDFQKFGASVNKHAWSLVLDWADQVGHACRDFVTSKREGESKAKATETNNTRWLHFEGGPGRDAKCRAGYEVAPEEGRIPLDWEVYQQHMNRDYSVDLINESIALYQTATDQCRETLEAKLSGKPTQENLAEFSVDELRRLKGWLATYQKENS